MRKPFQLSRNKNLFAKITIYLQEQKKPNKPMNINKIFTIRVLVQTQMAKNEPSCDRNVKSNFMIDSCS